MFIAEEGKRAVSAGGRLPHPAAHPTLTYLNLVRLTKGHERRRVVDPGNLDVS